MPLISYALLLLAAGLEIGGDALVRLGLQSPSLAGRGALIAAGGAVLLAYGLTVNSPSSDFGRLLGVYVSLVFVLAQFVNWSLFGVRPAPPILLGGALIFAGGFVVAFWRS